MAGGRGLTIGEAAARLAAEFPGLTVSALRRLEADGRIAPGRTATGYRRYSEGDLDRVRAVLSGFEPLPEPGPPTQGPEAKAGARATRAGAARVPAARPAPSARAQSSAIPAGATATVSTVQASARRGPAPSPLFDMPAPTAATTAGSAAVSAPRTAVSPMSQHSESQFTEPQSPESPRPTPASRRAERRWPEADFFAPDLGEVTLDRDQLAAAARADRAWVDGLVEYGLLPEAESAGGADLLVARASAELAQFGVEPRHLRAVAASAARVAELINAATTAGAARDASRRERAALAAPGRTAEAAAAAVRLHAALVRAALLRA